MLLWQVPGSVQLGNLRTAQLVDPSQQFPADTVHEEIVEAHLFGLNLENVAEIVEKLVDRYHAFVVFGRPWLVQSDSGFGFDHLSRVDWHREVAILPHDSTVRPIVNDD